MSRLALMKKNNANQYHGYIILLKLQFLSSFKMLR